MFQSVNTMVVPLVKPVVNGSVFPPVGTPCSAAAAAPTAVNARRAPAINIWCFMFAVSKLNRISRSCK